MLSLTGLSIDDEDVDVSLINSLPHALREALKELTYPVEFDRLTDAFVVSTGARRLKLKHGVLSDPQNPNADSLQHTLNPVEWGEAGSRWLEAIQSFHSYCYKQWKQVYDANMFGSGAKSRSFEERREYDILLRAIAVPVGNVRPSWKYRNLWTQAERIVAARRADEERRKDEATSAELAELKRLVSVRSNQSQSRSFQGSPSQPRQFQAGQADEPRNETNTSGKKIFCYVCGSSLHTSFRCSAIKKVVGSKGDVFVRREGRDWVRPGLFRNEKEKRFCYPFNLHGGCRYNGVCDRGVHLCSLCGDFGHSATTCSA